MYTEIEFGVKYAPDQLASSILFSIESGDVSNLLLNSNVVSEYQITVFT